MDGTFEPQGSIRARWEYPCYKQNGPVKSHQNGAFLLVVDEVVNLKIILRPSCAEAVLAAYASSGLQLCRHALVILLASIAFVIRR